MFLVCFLSGYLDCSLVTGLLVMLVFGWIIGCFFFFDYLMGGLLFGNIYPTTNVRGHVPLAKFKMILHKKLAVNFEVDIVY